MTLHDYLMRERGIEPVQVADGVATPRRFTDARVEHTAARQTVGLFDFSFMACFDVGGPDAARYLERVQTRRIRPMAPGQVAYTLLCRDDGSVMNDATVWCHGAGRYTLYTGRRSDAHALMAAAEAFDVRVEDVSSARAACAVQGPLALRTLQDAIPGHVWSSLPYFGMRTIDVDGVRCDIARIGYTGEAGFEAVTDASAAPWLWQRFASAGAQLGLAECGFDAADSLRIEAGFVLFSRELVQHVTPYELRLGRLLSQPGFIGAPALARARWREPRRCLAGFAIDGAEGDLRLAGAEEAPRPGRAVLTSARRSPLYGRWLGLGFVHPEDRAPGTRVALAAGRRATVARLPFYDPMKRRPRHGWLAAAAAFA